MTSYRYTGPWHITEIGGDFFIQDNYGDLFAKILDDCTVGDRKVMTAAPDLLDALKETRDALMCAMRFLAGIGLADDWIEACKELGIKDGFGVRSVDAIKKAEGK